MIFPIVIAAQKKEALFSAGVGASDICGTSILSLCCDDVGGEATCAVRGVYGTVCGFLRL